MYHMHMFDVVQICDLLTRVGHLYDVITENGPWPETVTYQTNIVHGLINKNQYQVYNRKCQKWLKKRGKIDDDVIIMTSSVFYEYIMMRENI